MIVFVHGVPETAVIWDRMRALTTRGSVALALPGFGSERPPHFGATKDDYAAWLVAELQAIEEPVDLVGHDWGAGLTYRIALSHAELVRSWVADVANIVHPDYVWHDFARVWQTPGDGEAMFEAQLGQDPADVAAGYELLGISAPHAREMAEGLDATMAGCILDLYRSATPNIHADWGPLAPSAAPGLVLSAEADPFGDDTLARAVADALGARIETLPGAGHFWPYQAPEKAAAVLEDFWSTLDEARR